jgi:hypothetical protein
MLNFLQLATELLPLSKSPDCKTTGNRGHLMMYQRKSFPYSKIDHGWSLPGILRPGGPASSLRNERSVPNPWQEWLPYDNRETLRWIVRHLGAMGLKHGLSLGQADWCPAGGWR